MRPQRNDGKTLHRIELLEDRVTGDDAFFLECLWQEQTGLPARVWSSGLPTFAVPILRVQTSHAEVSDLGQCVGVSISQGKPTVVCKTILIETVIGVHLAGKSPDATPSYIPTDIRDSFGVDDFRLVALFIRRNRKALIRHWTGTIGTAEFLSKLRKV